MSANRQIEAVYYAKFKPLAAKERKRARSQRSTLVAAMTAIREEN
jgi:hypothetical protein